ncbi:hypothetical protein EAF04_001107 [Stromatinia cepivora]|nr:hypothetical protein EAF04_001107 [Stromatinia cepivora]
MVFSNSNPVILLAEPQDTPRLAAITTRALEASDAIFPHVWGNTAPGAHDAAVLLLFNQLQGDAKATWKIKIDGKIVGYARWFMPVDSEMAGCKAECKQRDYDAERDMLLDLCFVDPEYQRLGIGNILLRWGMEIADKRGGKICLVSTPQARKFYEKGGWVVRKSSEIDLESYGGSRKYGRCWMIREVQDRKY